ncbi:hypothetical protein V6N11_072114 [Hibiscus sabdariffa]|uniref:Uncharacterized protein n=1 Tax=Hibiscus sabdariffa TaxID=183260 RepID=A0ABR2U219_9ROSI
MSDFHLDQRAKTIPKLEGSISIPGTVPLAAKRNVYDPSPFVGVGNLGKLLSSLLDSTLARSLPIGSFKIRGNDGERRSECQVQRSTLLYEMVLFAWLPLLLTLIRKDS